MTSWQKAINYLSIALAILLTVNIFSAIFGALGLIGLIDDRAPLKTQKTYAVSDGITAIDIEIDAARLTIQTAETFEVKSNLKNLKVDEEDHKLVIREKNGRFITSSKGMVTVLIPKNNAFARADINTGAGAVTINDLTADKLSIDLGAGAADFSHLTAKDEAVIDGGAGKLTVSDSTLHNFKLDMGVGAVNLSGAITGNSSFDCGVGAVNAKLYGNKEDYTVYVDKGIGAVTLDGEGLHDDEIYGNGQNKLEINSGVGSVGLKFENDF